MKQFEYKLVSYIGILVENTFNKLGKEGWELVCMKGSSDYIFKREIL